MRLGMCLLALCTAPSLAAQDTGVRVPARFERVGTLPRSGPVRESSGVAVSRQYPGILWTHNDSGSEPVLYAMQLDGTLVGEFRVQGARNVDWEDLALGPCPENRETTCLFVGDVGDNMERRTRGIVYILPEPDPAGGTHPVSARAVRVRYADGPHDVEAIAVDAAGSLHVVTKGRTGGIIRYEIPAPDLLADSVTVAPRETLPVTPQRMSGRWVTGAAVSPSSGRVAVRTYTEIYFFRAGPEGWIPDGPSCWLGFVEPFGEAVDFLDDDTLVLTSETLPRTDGMISKVQC